MTLTPEERYRLRKQRLWEAHQQRVEAQDKAERDEARRIAYNKRKRAYNAAYRQAVKDNPEAYAAWLEARREYNREWRKANKDNPAYKRDKAEQARKDYHQHGGRAKAAERYRRWKEEHPEEYAAKLARNRERRRTKHECNR
jgi:hypothetical protein